MSSLPDLAPTLSTAPATTRRTLRRSRLVRAAFALVALAAVAAVRDLVAGHDPARGPALLLALAAGWCLVMNAASGRPYLTYTRGLRLDSSGAVTVPPEGLWSVEIANAGERAARLTAIRYFVQLLDGPLREWDDAIPVNDLLREMEWVDERDYLLVRLTPSFAFGPGERQVLMELPLPLARRLSRIGATLTVSGPFGTVETLRVEAHPPHGLPQGAMGR